MKKVKITKTRKQSKTQIAKSKANNNKKAFEGSISGLVRYAKNEGRKDLEKLISLINDKNNTNISLNRVCDKKTILGFYGLTKDGKRREKFSYYNHVLACVNKLAQIEKSNRVNKKALKVA